MEEKTPLYDCHVELKGKMVSFAGYLLPVQYEQGLVKEHLAVRNEVGIFDVSHMGEILVEGEDSLSYIQKLVTNDCSKMYDGQVKYSPICNEEGGVIDDLLIYKLNNNRYILVVNAANREKDLKWMKANEFGNVTLSDISDDIALIAVQGPKSKQVLLKLMDEELLPKKYYSFKDKVNIAGCEAMVSKTGYTGELGYEIYCKSLDAKTIWNELLEKGKDEGIVPCGLGCRDTLRLEAGMPLYGNELSDSITPLEAGLSFTVKMNKENFIGKEAILNKGESNKVRVGIKITGRGIAREDCKVFYDDKEIGQTTSGTHLPYVDYAGAMAYVDKAYSSLGTKVLIQVRKRHVEGEIVDLPFYKRDN